MILGVCHKISSSDVVSIHSLIFVCKLCLLWCYHPKKVYKFLIFRPRLRLTSYNLRIYYAKNNRWSVLITKLIYFTIHHWSLPTTQVQIQAYQKYIFLYCCVKVMYHMPVTQSFIICTILIYNVNNINVEWIEKICLNCTVTLRKTCVLLDVFVWSKCNSHSYESSNSCFFIFLHLPIYVYLLR